MKSNIYSVFVFLIGISISYYISFQLTEDEKKHQQKEMQIEIQSISHNIQDNIENIAKQVRLVAGGWNTLDNIKHNWVVDSNSLKKLNPFIEKIKLFPVTEEATLAIPKEYLIQYQHEVDKNRQLRNRQHLPSTIDKLNYKRIYISRASYSHTNKILFDLQFPMIIEQTLIAYIEVSIDINKLLHHEIDTFQITNPFSLSENGTTVFSSLPNKMHINDVTEQFVLPIYDREWTLMIWSNVIPRDKDLFLIFTLLISFLMAVSVKLFSLYFVMRRKIIDSHSHLKRADNEFKNSEAKLIQSNKLTSLGEIATGIAHEINQPLQVICIHTDMCQDNLAKKNYDLVEKSFKAIVSQIERIEKIVKQVGSFGRDSELDKYQKEKAADIFNNVISIVSSQYKQDLVELRQVIPPSLPLLYCNKTQIEQVLVNLLINAKDSVETSEEKIVFIKAHTQNQFLYIQVSDTGTGIDPTKINEIFTPFYTTKPLGKGTGLGLSISYSIIIQHKGEISVSSEIGEGSVFTIKLPL